MEKIGKRFQGKVAIVTASTQGIGFSIAERIGGEGAAIAISSRKQKNVDEAVEKLRSKGIEVLGVVCHVSNAEHRKNLVERTVQAREDRRHGSGHRLFGVRRCCLYNWRNLGSSRRNAFKTLRSFWKSLVYKALFV
nr:tropinone reductase-like 3 [Ipomoea batatas]